jgi:hypothetical protein
MFYLRTHQMVEYITNVRARQYGSQPLWNYAYKNQRGQREVVSHVLMNNAALQANIAACVAERFIHFLKLP